MWIKQEVLLSRQVLLMCSEATAPLEALSVFLKRAVYHGMTEYACTAANSPATTLYRQQVIYQTPGSELPQRIEGLESVLEQFESSTCTDARDKIYGSLGLVKTELEPDYSKSVIDLYSDLMARFNAEITHKGPENHQVRAQASDLSDDNSPVRRSEPLASPFRDSNIAPLIFGWTISAATHPHST